MTWSETALGSGETGELPVNAVGFGSVASEHSAKSFSSWITPPHAIFLSTQSTQKCIKMPVTKQAVKLWAQLELSVHFLCGHQRHLEQQ